MFLKPTNNDVAQTANSAMAIFHKAKAKLERALVLADEVYAVADSTIHELNMKIDVELDTLNATRGHKESIKGQIDMINKFLGAA